MKAVKFYSSSGFWRHVESKADGQHFEETYEDAECLFPRIAGIYL
jgi:hypothetical protein